MEFLVDIEMNMPVGMPEDELADIKSRERERGKEFVAQGKLRRIWRRPGRRASVSLYEVSDATELHELLSSLPQFPWMEIRITALAEHPLDASSLG